MGTFLLGRNIGLFGQDAILGDMTLLGVGAVRHQRGAGQYVARLDRPRLHLYGLARADQLHDAGLQRLEVHDRHLRSARAAGSRAGSATPEERAGIPRQGRVHARRPVPVGDVPVAEAEGVTDAVGLRQHGVRLRRQVQGRAGRSSWPTTTTARASARPALFFGERRRRQRARLGRLPRAGDLHHQQDEARHQLRREQPRSRERRGAARRSSRRTASSRFGVYHKLTENLTLLGEFTNTQVREPGRRARTRRRASTSVRSWPSDRVAKRRTTRRSRRGREVRAAIASAALVDRLRPWC